MQETRWGIIGCGGIANAFASGLRALDHGILLAGASRTPGRAQAFADKHGVERSYTDYKPLAADPDIDAVYIATTHNFHFENVKLCLEHGKHVLCEKPFTVNAGQARELAALARDKNLFLMEALWTRFLPAIQKLRKLLADGEIGEVQTVYTNFCLGRKEPPEHRLRNIDLAGGSLLDIGVYTISMADIVFGQKPERILGCARMDATTGVDECSYYFLDYAGGKKAVLSSSYSQAAPAEALVCGTKGYIRIPHFLGARQLHVHRSGEDPEVLECPYGEGENFKYEIAHAMECIESGRIESDIMPLFKTIEIMETMDELRRQWNLSYPGEQA